MPNYIYLAAFSILLLNPLVMGQMPARREPKNYSQWKDALNTDKAVDPKTIQVPEGYAVELLYSATKDQGSLISLAFDAKGRLYVGRESKGIIRLTLPKMQEGKLAGEAIAGQIKIESVNEELLEPRGLLFVENELYVNANNSKGFYRLRDGNGDDTFDEVKLLKAIPGDVGHGRNDLTLGPDGKLYLILGNDTLLPEGFQQGVSAYRNYERDRLLPCDWNKNLFNYGVKPPAGVLVRTDREGGEWEVVAGGLRNPFGIAFNRQGDAFTFDADMEWDAGATWYRPTRINHLVSGGDFGWRQGVDKWRVWYPDSLPSNLDIGLASPTAVKNVPDSFRPAASPGDGGAILACDWAYGRIHWVELEPSGASYIGKDRPFISGRPLNVCDVEFGPDNSLYFVIGGRRTQSGIYRVVRVGSPEKPVAPSAEEVARMEAAKQARETRRQLEKFHGRVNPAAVDAAWPYLKHADVWLRHAARVALEAQPSASWRERALAEQNAMGGLQALLALVRVEQPSDCDAVLERLAKFDWKGLTKEERIALLRIYQLVLIRWGEQAKPHAEMLRTRMENLYPADFVEGNDLLCELLVHLESLQLVKKTLPLLDAASTPEEKLHYLMCLRLVKGPWEIEQRKLYFAWLQRAEKFPGAHYMPRFLEYIRQDAIATLREEEKVALGDLLKPAPTEDKYGDLPPRVFVKDWKLEDFQQELSTATNKPVAGDVVSGKELFVAAQCARCHRYQGEGSLVGPDLSSVGKRFGPRDMLLHTIEPSKVIDDKYKQVTVFTVQGQVLVGQQVAADAESLSVITDPTQPTKVTRVLRSDIEELKPSLLSPMPAGLLNTLEREEVMALLYYLQQGEAK